jgi:hypothetical protein
MRPSAAAAAWEPSRIDITKALVAEQEPCGRYYDSGVVLLAAMSACIGHWNAIVPPWLEILLDVLGFAGFIGLAIWHKSPRKDDETVQR